MAMKKVLIVEDEAAMLDALENKFKKSGFKVVTGHDGEEAVVLAKTERPDAVMLDIIMPKLDGLGAMKAIRGLDKWGREVPIILLTNLSDPDNVSEAAKYKVFDFLVKTDWRLDDVLQLAKDKLGM
jgi:two-component system alkaline phosphatase synthesis response regulator PhoP